MPPITKKFLIGLILPLLILPFLVVGLACSLAGTASGTRWLAGQVSRLAGDTLAWEGLEGTLLESLQVRGLRLRLPGMSLDVQALDFDWRPALILGGTLQVDRIAADGVSLALTDSGEREPAAGPFDPTRLDLPIDINLAALAVSDIELLVAEGPPRRIDTISLAVRLQDHQLSLRQLEIDVPEGRVSASGDLGLTHAMPLAVALQWDWRVADQALGGDLQATGDAESLAITHRGRGAMPLNLSGTLQTILTQPGWELGISWPELAVTTGQTSLLVGPGKIATEGSPDNYRVAGEGQLTPGGMAPIGWSLSAGGTVDGIRLAPLTVSSGPYELALSGGVSWQGPIDANLSYRASAEQLALLNPQLPPRLDASGALVMRFEQETLTLERLDLMLEQAPLQVASQGRVRLPAGGDPVITGELHWHSLQWPIQTSVAEAVVASPEGRVLLAGSPDAWTVELAAQMAGGRVPAGEWLGRGEGDRTALHLDYLRGRLLEGEVSLAGDLGWSPAPRWNLAISGDDLNPGQWQPDLPGRLTFDAGSEGRVDPASGPQGTFALRQLSGELAGRPLALAGHGAVAGETVRLDSLVLSSGDNRLSASGELAGQRLRMDWALVVRDPGVLLPGSAGSLDVSGRVSGSPANPGLQARLAGQDLQYEDRHLHRLAANLQAGMAADSPLQVSIELGPLQQAEQSLLDSARLTAAGTTASHRLELALGAGPRQLQGRLQGGLNPEQSSWRGELAALAIEDPGLGRWALADAASLVAAPGRGQLGDACLQSGPGEIGGNASGTAARICAGGEWRTEAGARANLSLESFALARLLPGLTGELSGELSGAMAADGMLTARGRIDATPGEMQVETGHGIQQLAHGGGQLALTVGADGLHSALEFSPLENGQIRAELTMSGLSRLPLADSQPLAGRVQAELPDLNGLQGWVPELEAVAGRLDADFDLAGDLQQPQLRGELALTEGAAAVPLAGLQLRDIRMRLRTDPAEPAQMLVTGGLSSGEGWLELNGRLSPRGDMLALDLTGEAVEVFDTRDAQVRVSPDLQLDWGDQLLRLRGSLAVPEARITPRLDLSPGLASREVSPATAEAAGPQAGEILAPSADVVVVGGENDPRSNMEAELPFRLDSEVQLVLGDKVQVNALGFVGRIAGKVSFRNRPQRTEAIPIADGRLSIEEGFFRAFGQDLEIETGQVIFRKVPVTEPEVNLRAVRWIDNDPLVSAAGVQVSGRLASPMLELFSRPQLDPTEIQSYLLTGHSASGGDSVLSIGAYLYPKLYVGYGYNLLEETSEFNGLYTITPRYGIETSVGEADNSVGVTITYEH